MNVSNRQQLLVIIAAAGVVLLACDSLLLTPLNRLWKERAARIVELRKSVAQGSSILEREQTLRDRWDSMRTNTLGSDVSAAENQVLKAFDKWALDSRIGINSIKPQGKGKRDEDEYMTLKCRVDAVGSLSALTRFLYEIEKDPMALKVEDLEISTRDAQGRQLALRLQVSGLILNPPREGGN